MIFGIGTDIIEVERIERYINKGDAFRDRVFTESEVSYCGGSKNRMERYAARFAAKEAMFKAMGTGCRGEMSFRNIEVVSDEMGKPMIKAYGAVSDFLKQNNIMKIHLSMSHLKSMAIATVLLEKETI